MSLHYERRSPYTSIICSKALLTEAERPCEGLSISCWRIVLHVGSTFTSSAGPLPTFDQSRYGKARKFAVIDFEISHDGAETLFSSGSCLQIFGIWRCGEDRLVRWFVHTRMYGFWQFSWFHNIRAPRLWVSHIEKGFVDMECWSWRGERKASMLGSLSIACWSCSA